MDLFVLVCSVIILSYFEISSKGDGRGLAFAAAADSPSTPSVQVIIQGSVLAGKDTTLQCQIDQTTSAAAGVYIETLTWKKKQDHSMDDENESSTVRSNTTAMVPDTTEDIVLSFLMWTDNDTYHPQYVIENVSVEDEGVYCCEIATVMNKVSVTSCATVAVTVLPTLSFTGTNCDTADKHHEHCKSYGHIGKNLTCMAHHYRPLVKLKLKWRVDSLTLPFFPTHTTYTNYTDTDGFVYYNAHSTVKYTKSGTHRYTCTATEIGACGVGGCTVTDLVIVSRPNHLQLWWLIVPCLAIFTLLFIIKWRAHTRKPENQKFEQPSHVYSPVTATVETKNVDPEMEKFNINI